MPKSQVIFVIIFVINIYLSGFCMVIWFCMFHDLFDVDLFFENFQSGIIEDKLKLVRVGTEEYRRAARLKNLFKDFIDHQRQLHERLTLEHNKNLCPSRASQPAADQYILQMDHTYKVIIIFEYVL